MSTVNPETRLDARYSGDVAATPWPDAERLLAEAGIYWISTVRPDGRPHVTPIISVWHDSALHFCTGPAERKALNLAENNQVALTTGVNTYDGGLDIVVEGKAKRITDADLLAKLADSYVAKYGEDWRFEVSDVGAFSSGDHLAWVFRVEPVVAFGFGSDNDSSQTRWVFNRESDGR